MHKQNEQINLPKDSGPHAFSNMEWWYSFAFLTGDQGSRFATMASFFRIGEFEWNKGHYLIFSLIDLDRKTQKNASFLDGKLKFHLLSMYLPFYILQHPTNTYMWSLYRDLLFNQVPSPHSRMKNGMVETAPTKLLYGQHQLSYIDEKEGSFHAHLVDKEVKMDLTFTPQKRMALIGDNGKIDDLYYYSFTRNKVKGTIHSDKGKENVTGDGWFDHQWGRDYGLIQGKGWNWFGLQLSDGRELLLNEMRSAETGETFSTIANLVDIDGEVQLSRKVNFIECKYWKSFKTNAKYPIEWEIHIPDFSIKLHVKSIMDNQEMPILGPMQGIWEGACLVTGEEKLENGQFRQLLGKGFMELVGYVF